jgi:hypothetical protein
MESKLAEEAERALIEATQKLCPEERLNAFLEHCRLVTELYEAGPTVAIDWHTATEAMRTKSVDLPRDTVVAPLNR